MNYEKSFYELRIYTIIPKHYPELLELWENEGKPIIQKYMNCVGVWNSESGQLNKIFHLYKWENNSVRDEARNKFYNDINAQNYVKKVKPLYQSQESYILKALPELY